MQLNHQSRLLRKQNTDHTQANLAKPKNTTMIARLFNQTQNKRVFKSPIKMTVNCLVHRQQK